MAYHISCIIYNCKTKPDKLKYFTSVTLSKFFECRNIWLKLHGEQKDLAEKSLEHITEADEYMFDKTGDCEFINTREQIPQYHMDCYRKFIDKTRIEIKAFKSK
jgi:hypothetical protein